MWSKYESGFIYSTGFYYHRPGICEGVEEKGRLHTVGDPANPGEPLVWMQLHPWVSLHLPGSSGWAVCRKYAAAEAEEHLLLSANVMLHCRAQVELSVLWGVGLGTPMGSENRLLGANGWWSRKHCPFLPTRNELAPHQYYFYDSFPGGFHTTMGWIPSGYPSIISSICLFGLDMNFLLSKAVSS